MSRTPNAAATSIAQHWVEVYCTDGLSNKWMCYVPHFIATDEVVATAAQAVLFARQTKIDCSDTQLLRSQRLHSAALTRLQRRLSGSSADLVAVALLGRYEQVLGTDYKALAAHVRGITAILQSNHLEPRMQEIAMVFLQMTKVHRLYQPIADERASPFDSNNTWLESDPPQRFFKLSESCKAVKKLPNKIYIRLPRLVAEVKRARRRRTDELPRDEAVLKCITLADQLVATSDPRSEATLTEQCVYEVETEVGSRDILSSSFNFTSKEEMYDLLEYWKGRLFMINIVRNILEQTTSHWAAGMETADLHFDKESVSKEQHELVRNILKSVTAFEATGNGEIPVAIPSALIAVWGALPTLTEFNDIPIDRVKSWLFPKCAAALDHWRQNITMHELDQISDMFVGGPTESLFGTDLQLALLYRKYHAPHAA